MTYLIALVVAVVLFFLGATMSLFGPSFGCFLGVPAFILTWLFFFVLTKNRRAKPTEPFASNHPTAYRYSKSINIAMGVCGAIAVLSLVTLFVSSRMDGVAHGTSPVFDHRSEYLLNNHGHYTSVSRTRYLLVGSSFVIGWHAFGAAVALSAIHLVLYGQLSPPNKRAANQAL